MLRCRSPVLPSRPGEFHPEPLTADPGGRVTPRFWHLLIRFRHFIDGLLALASLNLACRILVPAFPQRSRPSLLTTAACGGLRSTPDCRSRRALLHLSYSCAPAVWTGSTRDTRPRADFLRWHESQELDKLEPRRDHPRGAKCGNAVEASNRSRAGRQLQSLRGRSTAGPFH